jgi:P63C domain
LGPYLPRSVLRKFVPPAGLEFPRDNVKRPQYFGHLTNDIIYKRLAPGVLEELKKVTPRKPNGAHKQHLHRRLSEDVGHPKLREHLASAITLMKLSKDYGQFEIMLDQIHPSIGAVPLLTYSHSEEARTGL